MGKRKRKLVNEVMANPYILERRNYHYYFFRISGDEYGSVDYIELEVDVESGQAELVLNGYLTDAFKIMTAAGTDKVKIPVSYLENGENTLAYKGQLEVLSITLHHSANDTADRPGYLASEAALQAVAGVSKLAYASTDSYGLALEFLLNSRITAPHSSQFAGSAYCIYDYTNNCYRMPCWLWSDAPIVSVLLDTLKSGRYPKYRAQMKAMAHSICEVFINTQITDEQEESYGAYVSRYRYYGRPDHSFNRLLGPNDTSFSVKWAMLPMYEYTGDERYLKSARLGLDWVEKVIKAGEFVPSHYYFENKQWEDRAFVDTGFCVEGFQKYDEISGTGTYTELIDFTMKRYIGQFKLDNGFYGQNYLPGIGVDDNLFARGQAWALEGLLACIREGMNVDGSDGRRISTAQYLAEAISLADLLTANQNANGSFSWSLGDYEPSEQVKHGTGECEKGTAVLAWLLMELYLLTKKESYQISSQAAVNWCSSHMKTNVVEGLGGIVSASSSSGITGMPFLEVATGYANAFYLMALNTMSAGNLSICMET